MANWVTKRWINIWSTCKLNQLRKGSWMRNRWVMKIAWFFFFPLTSFLVHYLIDKLKTQLRRKKREREKEKEEEGEKKKEWETMIGMKDKQKKKTCIVWRKDENAKCILVDDSWLTPFFLSLPISSFLFLLFQFLPFSSFPFLLFCYIRWDNGYQKVIQQRRSRTCLWPELLFLSPFLLKLLSKLISLSLFLEVQSMEISCLIFLSLYQKILFIEIPFNEMEVSNQCNCSVLFDDDKFPFLSTSSRRRWKSLLTETMFGNHFVSHNLILVFPHSLSSLFFLSLLTLCYFNE